MFISEQVKILLERMEMHPEEFIRSEYFDSDLPSKWSFLISSGEFNRVEKFLIKRKLKRVRILCTRNLILETILKNPSDEVEKKPQQPPQQLPQPLYTFLDIDKLKKDLFNSGYR